MDKKLYDNDLNQMWITQTHDNSYQFSFNPTTNISDII